MNKENSNIPQEKEEDRAQLQSGKTTKDESSSQYTSILYEIRKYSGEQYDKLIVYLSSGALILTVGFVEKVVDLSKIKSLSLLYFSWVLFVLSLIAILISHRTSLYSIDSEIKKAEGKSNSWNIATEILNWFSMICLVIGIIIFIIFVGKALPALYVKGG